jgi:hypothetical protein
VQASTLLAVGTLSTRLRLLWVLGLGLPVLAGIAAFIIENAIKPGHVCVTGNPSHGLRYFVVFLALALAPGVIVGVVGWRSRRSGVDTVGPFVATMCLDVILVFAGLLIAWHGHGCIT